MMEKTQILLKQRLIAFVFCFSLLGVVLSISLVRVTTFHEQDDGEATVNRIRDRFERLHED